MDLLDPTETMDRLKENTVEAIKPFFPYEGKVNKLVATNIYVGADTDVDDIATQKQARLRGRTWSTGVYGDFDLINKETGKKVDSVKGMKLVNLPQITRRYSFIIEGNERQADNQWRLKAGVYSRKKDNGDLEAQFNLAEGRGFRMGFYPQKRQFLLTYGTTNIQLIPALRALGHSDDSLRQKFGADVFDQLKGAKARGDIQKMAKAVDYKFQGGSDEEAAKVVRAALDKTVLRGDTTKITLGEPHEKVTTDTLVAAAKKLIDINKGTATVDNRDSLRFKELWTIDEHIPERIANSKQRITFKIKNNIDRKESVRDIVSMDIFNVPVKSFFTQTSLAQQTNQTNPIDMISGFLRTTIMGSGGIGSEQAVTMNAKMLDPSMLGVVDPIHTPEGNPGISNHLTIGLNKRGKEPLVFIFDNKKKTYGYKTPTELAAGTVGFSDQYERDSAGKLVPAGSLIAALPKGGGDPVLLKPSEVDFVLGSTKSMFSMAANLIPFLPSDQGNRAGMGVRHMEQTVALKDREVPLVQSATGLTNDEDDTFEKSMGKLAAHRSPATGKVISVSDDAIIVQGADKKKHTVHLYNNFPLNEKKSYVTSSPLVKVGDDVSEGDVVADTSHTKNGVLAIGTNIRLAYHDFAGLSVTGSTYVYWREVNGKGHFGPISDMPTAGAASLALDPLTYTTKLIPVHAHLLHAPDSDIYEVVTEEGAVVRATGSHSFITQNNLGELANVRPTEMVPNETLLPRAQPSIPWAVRAKAVLLNGGKSNSSRHYLVPADNDLGFLCGMYVAEGSVSAGKNVALAVTEPELISRVATICAGYGINTSHRYRQDPTGLSGTITLFSRGLAQFLLNNCGSLAENKRVPDHVWSGTREFAEGFLDGYWCGDGTVTKQASASTSSRALSEGLMFLLGAFGVRATRRKYAVVRAEREYRDQYLITVSNEYVQLMPQLTLSRKNDKLRALAECGAVVSRDRIPIAAKYAKDTRRAMRAAGHSLQETLPATGGYASRRVLRGVYAELPLPVQALVDAPVWWDTVESVTKVESEPIVYDLDMRPLANFLVSTGIVVHNTFEDSQVLSESAAKKLTSVHMTKPRAFLDRGMSVDLKKFRAQFPGVITDDNAKKLDDDGVIKKGQTVNPGDVIMSVLKKTEPSPEQVMLKGIHKALARPYKNAAVTWDSDFSGTVTDVVRNGNEITAYVTTEEPAQVGDKFSMRHGGKGTVSAILPDEEMPVDKDGNHVEMIVSPSGVPGRVNPGQVLENMLGKVAKKTGTTYAVDNFQSNGRTRIVQVKGHFRTVKGEDGTIKRTWVDPHTREVGYHELVKQALAKHKVSETDELFDPKTGKSFGQILNGYTYILKLQHQVEKGLAARSHGAGNAYDVNMAPKGGGDTSAQTFGELGLYSLLSHGATGVVSESLNYKSDRGNQDVWTAIQAGEPIPAPKTPFVYDKFVAYLNAIGIDVKKEGNNLHLVPFTDKAIKEKSTGELSDPTKMIRGKDLSPEVGGLFDPKRTGGPGGKLWSSFALAEPVPNPVFEKPIRSLLGLTAVQYEAILKGEQAINGKTGPEGIAAALKSINVDKELEKEKGNLKTARRGALDLAYKKVKYLQSLKDLKLRADEAYVLTSIPVVPPMFRPIMVMEGGDLNTDGLNLLYKNIALVSNQLKEGKDVLPDSALYNLRSSLYAEVESLVGNKAAETVMEGGEKKPPGILTILAGTQPKHSYIHEKLMSRRQDLSGRAVITLDQSLGLDQIGIPREAAFELYRPFIVKELVQQGYTPLSAREEIAKRTSLANRALEVASAKRPVLFKRDPVLHKFGIMGFDVKLHDGKSITINPSITGGFNADFDGDKMGVFVPVTDQAVREVQGMKPSKNMFNTPMDEVMYQPSLGGQLGLYLISLTGRDTGKKFSSEKDALAAMEKGDLRATDLITVGGKKTTPGRLAVYATVPASVRNEAWLTDPEFTLGKKNLQKVFRAVALKSPEEFGPFVTRITAVGFNHVHSTGFSYAAKDFDTLSELRDNVLKIADKEVEKVRASGTLSAKQKDDAAVRIYTDATKEMNARAVKILDTTGNKLRMMNNAGVKPSWEQVQQLILAPMLLTNAQGRVIPAPVRNSYSEGLDGAGYWTASSGARKGLVDKVLSVRDPGALSKQIMNTAVPYAITVEDCGTDKGIMLDAADANLLDRFTAKDIAVGGQTYKAGTELSPNFIDKLRQAKVAKVLARSPLKCQAPHGLCSRCFGVMPGGKLPSIGTNIGVISGQAIGERGTQLSMKAFHLGGLAGSDSKVTSALGRVTQLLKMPETLPDAATLAATSGKVSSMTKSPLGGFDVRIGDEDHYIPGGREPKVKVGDQVEKGDMLSDGSIDPRELLDLTNMDRVQRYMSDELYSAYAGERIKRRNSEVVVKAMTNLAKIDDPGDSDEFVRGDPVSLAYVEHLNRTKGYKNPIQFTPWLRGLETLPLDRTTDWGQRLQYRHLKETFTRGAGEGWKSDIHGGFMPAALFGNEFGKSPDLSKSPY